MRNMYPLQEEIRKRKFGLNLLLANKRLLFLVVSAISLFFILGIAVGFFVSKIKNSKIDTEGVFFQEMERFVVNNPSNFRNHKSLKLVVVLCVRGEKNIQKVRYYLPVVRNSFITFFNNIGQYEIEKGDILGVLEYELQKRANNILPGKIEKILIKEIFLE